MGTKILSYLSMINFVDKCKCLIGVFSKNYELPRSPVDSSNGAAAHLLPGRPQELDVGLGVVDAGQDVEQLGLLPRQVGEPVLDKGGAVREQRGVICIGFII